MEDQDAEDTRQYVVLMNHEEQYSIWLASHAVPDGWHTVGSAGPKAECLAYVDAHWTDMRPLSLRKKMEQAERFAAEAPSRDVS